MKNNEPGLGELFETIEEELKFMADVASDGDDDQTSNMFIRYLAHIRGLNEQIEKQDLKIRGIANAQSKLYNKTLTLDKQIANLKADCKKQAEMKTAARLHRDRMSAMLTRAIQDKNSVTTLSIEAEVLDRVLNDMCRAGAPDSAYTDTVDDLDAAITLAKANNSLEKPE